MNINWIITLLVVSTVSFSFLFILSCKDDDITSLDFSGVVLEEVVLSNDLGSVILNGRIDNVDIDDIVEIGFLRAENLSELNTLNSGVKLPPVNLNSISDRIFNYSVDSLDLHKTYYFQAYAITKAASINHNRTVFSKSQSFTLGVKLSLTSNYTISNDTAEVNVCADNVQKNGILVEKFGVVYSEDQAALNIENSLNIIQREELLSDDIHTFLIPGLAFNTPYYYRAWAQSGDIVYYSEIGNFHTKGGWKQMENPGFTLIDASASSHDSRSFIFTCKTTPQTCNLVDSRILVFDANSNSAEERWTFSSAQLLSFPTRSNTVSFIIADKLYIGLGTNSSNQQIRDFNQFNINGLSENITFFNAPSEFKPREGAVAFVVGDSVAYIGAGKQTPFPGEPDIFFNDFWEFSPTLSTMRPVAALPMKKSVFDPIVDTTGRTEAIAFSINGYGYVGGGVHNLTMLKDMWKFTPPTDQNPDGIWTFHSFFPGFGRFSSVYFVINDIGYFGSGRSLTSGLLDDFWKFDPLENGFQQLENIPTSHNYAFVGRSGALGFGVQENGYVGFGEGKDLDGAGFVISAEFQDVWQYTPQKSF